MINKKNKNYWLYFTNNILPLVKGYQSKTPVKKTHTTISQKTIPIILNLLKLTCPRKLKGFFYAYHFGVSFDQKT
jgi:hypothetical protein